MNFILFFFNLILLIIIGIQLAHFTSIFILKSVLINDSIALLLIIS